MVGVNGLVVVELRCISIPSSLISRSSLGTCSARRQWWTTTTMQLISSSCQYARYARARADTKDRFLYRNTGKHNSDLFPHKLVWNAGWLPFHREGGIGVAFIAAGSVVVIFAHRKLDWAADGTRVTLLTPPGTRQDSGGNLGENSAAGVCWCQ